MKTIFYNRKINFLTSAMVLCGNVSAQYSPCPRYYSVILISCWLGFRFYTFNNLLIFLKLDENVG